MPTLSENIVLAFSGWNYVANIGYSFASIEATKAVPLGMNDNDVTSQNCLRLWSDSKYSGEMAKE